MVYIILIVSLVFGLIGISIGLYTYRKYTFIVHSVKPVSFVSILKLAMLMGISGCFSFFALIAFFGTILERKSDWAPQSISGLLVVSLIFGAIGSVGSLYQIYTTVKYRDLLIKGKFISKED